MVSRRHTGFTCCAAGVPCERSCGGASRVLLIGNFIFGSIGINSAPRMLTHTAAKFPGSFLGKTVVGWLFGVWQAWKLGRWWWVLYAPDAPPGLARTGAPHTGPQAHFLTGAHGVDLHSGTDGGRSSTTYEKYFPTDAAVPPLAAPRREVAVVVGGRN